MRHRPPPAVNGALSEMLEADGELDRILDGRGPSYDPPRTIDRPAPDPGLVIEPPPWFGDPAPPGELAHDEPVLPGGALAEMKAADPDIEEPPPPAPVIHGTWRPPQRPAIPEVDWRAPDASSWENEP